jgi:hypothetical protein
MSCLFSIFLIELFSLKNYDYENIIHFIIMIFNIDLALV